MTVLLVGATSQIGYFLLPRLLAEGAQVLALSRRQHAPTAGVTWLQGQLPEPPDLPGCEPTLRAVVSVGPLNALTEWLRHWRWRGPLSVVATSSMSAQSKRASLVPAERALARHLQDSETALLTLSRQRGWHATVLRPTIIYGTGRDKSFSPLVRRAQRSGVFPLPRGKGLRQPVHADDIAQAVMAVLRDPASVAGQVIEIGGGERLSASEMFARVRRSVPRWTLPLPLWHAPLQLVSLALPSLRGPVSRLGQDLIADNRVLQQTLGVVPRRFEPQSATWDLGVDAERAGVDTSLRA